MNAGDLAKRLYFQGASQVGSRSGDPQLVVAQNRGSYNPQPLPNDSMGLLKNQQQRDQQQQQQGNNTPSYDTVKRFLPQQSATPVTQGTTAAAPQGSALVAGNIGNAAYASNFGLAGASQGLTYAGAQTAGTAAASQAGLAGASQGLTYGAGNAAATAGSQWGLGAASQGLTYGGTAATTGASTAGTAAASTGGSAAAGGASSGYGAVMSNPWTAAAAAILAHANYNDNKGISSWGDSLKGKAMGNMLDYYGGDKDGKTHGFIGKIVDKDGATGKSAKGLSDFQEFDFKNGFKNAVGGIKDVFRLKFF